MPFTVQHLMDSQQKIVSVTPDQPVQNALDLMIENDYSQLPVIDGDKRVLGLVTSDSIIRALNHFGVAVAALRVGDAIAKVEQVRVGDDLFDLLDKLRDQYSVLIVDGQRRLVGIVTSYDATEYIRRRVEDIMLVEDIESIVKDDVIALFATSSGETENPELKTAIAEITDSKQDARKRFEKALKQYLQLQNNSIAGFDPERADKVFTAQFGKSEPPKPFEKLTLYEYTELLLHKSRWEKLKPVFNLDSMSIRKVLDDVRETRNMLAHFRGEITAKQRNELRFCNEWLSGHRVPNSVNVQVTPATANAEDLPPTVVANVEIAPTEETPDADDSKYAPLALYLQQQPAEVKRLTINLGEIENIIHDQLPASARTHRSWWANDSVGHVQSQQWLSVGWRVAEIEMAEKQVTFARIVEREQAYIHFYSKLLADLKHVAVFPTKSTSPQGVNWQPVVGVPAAGERVASLYFSFTRQGQFSVGFYIDTGDADKNKQIFDYLYARRQVVESDFGEPLVWDRLEKNRGSRIAIYQDGTIADSKQKLVQLNAWGIRTMVRLQEVMDRQVRDLSKFNLGSGKRGDS